MVLAVIGAGSVILVNEAREDGGSVLHTVEVGTRIIAPNCEELRRAEGAARSYLQTCTKD